MERRGFFAMLLGGLVGALWPKREAPTNKTRCVVNQRYANRQWMSLDGGEVWLSINGDTPRRVA